MQEKIYKIFGLNENATNEEIDARYQELRTKYRNDMFLEGKAGNDAAKKLTELENTYLDYVRERSSNAYSNGSAKFDNSEIYNKVENLVKSGNINEAQDILDNIKERNGLWHYYQAMVYYKKDWFTDSKKQLEIAISMEPDNQKYKTAKERLDKLMSGDAKKNTDKKEKRSGEEWWKEHSNNQNSQNYNESPNWDENNRQMGGCDQTMSCCLNLLCINAICNCLGGGC